MSTERSIDELLREDEARLKAKRKRLSTFGKAVDDARAAQQKAQETAAEILEAGDLTRADLARVFDLSRGERSTLVPATPKRPSGSVVTDTPVETTHAPEQRDEPHAYPSEYQTN